MSQSTQTPGWGPLTTPPPPKRKRHVGRIILAVLAVLFVIGWISSLVDGNSDTSTATQTPEVTSAPVQVETPVSTDAPKPTTPEADASTQLSCGHFRNVMGDIGNSLLTDNEIRDKTKQFYDTGQRSNIPKIRLATQRMLAAITVGDTDAYIAAAKSMNAACAAVGQ
jgi:hypothetical protein